jgi:hypothetical protein
MLVDLAPAVEQFRLVQVVRAAAKLDVGQGCLITHAMRVEMMKLLEGALVAAATILASEGTATAIAEPDGAAKLRGNIA